MSVSPQLHAALELPTQTHIAVGAGSAMLVSGWCFHTQSALVKLSVVVDDVCFPVSHLGLVRLDIRDVFPDMLWHHSHALTSGFRTIVPLRPVDTPEKIEICLEATLETGEILTTSVLKHVLLEPHPTQKSVAHDPTDTPLIAICMAVYNSDRRFFQMQIDSIRAQTYPHWQCFIQDDASDEAAYHMLIDVIGDDTRFHMACNAKNLGSFHAFESALGRVPTEAGYIMLCSHDNIWHDDLLQTFLDAFTPDVMLVTSDMMVIDGEERVLSETFWDERDFEAESLDRLLLANTVSGAATIFRRELLTYVLPFPPGFANAHDDLWIALVALIRGRIRYINRPLLRFRHHGQNVVGWPNIKPYDTSELARLIREWTGAAHPSLEWQQQGAEIAGHALLLTKRRLWAEILKMRLPEISDSQDAQLTWICRMDESPRGLRSWIRERGGAPRVTVNMEWLLLYAQSVERLFARYARRHWQHFHLIRLHPQFMLAFKIDQTSRGRRATSLSMREVIAYAVERHLETSQAAYEAVVQQLSHDVAVQRAAHEQQAATFAAERDALQAQVHDLSVWVQHILTENASLSERREGQELDYIRSLRAWKIIQRWYGIKSRLLPVGSRRERAYTLVRTSVELATQDGLHALADRLRRWLRGERRYVPQRLKPSDEVMNAVFKPTQAALENRIAITRQPDQTHSDTSSSVDDAASASSMGILNTALDLPRETHVAIGAGSALLLIGWVFHTDALITQLAVLVNDQRTPVLNFPLVRRDVRDVYSEAAQSHGGVLNSGYRVIVPLDPIESPQTVDIVLEATLETGVVVTQIVKTMELLPHFADDLTHKLSSQTESNAPLVVICMATYNSNPRFFREQVESIRAQTYPHWVCLIQDDASNESAWTMMQGIIADDPRFIIEHSAKNQGIYLNFEACLRRVPGDAAFVVFSDQDDIWEQDKLAVLMAAMTPERVFVYSDHTIIDGKGRVISETGWIERRHHETDLDRLLMVNHIAGSTCLFRASLLQVALPFPPLLTDWFHDHWLAAIALTQGEIGYVETPLTRYRQHGKNVIGWWNQPPPNPDILANTLREWFMASDDAKVNQHFNIHFEKSVWLISMVLWADVLLRRAPRMPPAIKTQLQWIRGMDGQPIRLRKWIRERGNVPRITLNIEWHLLYVLVAQQALTRYGQRHWRRFNSDSRLALSQIDSASCIDYDSLRYRYKPAEEVLITVLEKSLIPPPDMMLRVQNDANLDEWRRIGREFLHYSRVLAGVLPSASVLDIGCGAGRIAMALIPYLQAEGRYEGFDIHRESVAWVQTVYKRRWSHVGFQHVDLYNSVYNAHGRMNTTGFQFRYPDKTFDYALIASVFTHMLPRDVAHYWDEIARTLKPGGRVMATAFLLNEDSRLRLNRLDNSILLPHDLGVYRVSVLQEPEKIVAYDELFMRTIITAAGLVLENVYLGSWCGRETFLSYQDMMLVSRPQ